MTARLARLWRWLRSRERRMHCCAVGEHRDTLDTWGGSAMRWRCLDCGHTAFAGWVLRGVSNFHPEPRDHE